MKRISLLVLLMMFLSGCTQTENLPNTQEPTLTQRSTSIPTATLQPALQPIASNTANPSLVPALSKDEATQRVAELFETNNGCNLPCFWGIVPGQTNLADAKTILDELASIDYGPHRNESWAYDYFFDVGKPNTVGVHVTLYTDKDIVDFVGVTDFDSPSYHLPEFLSRNGAPDQILVRTWKNSPSNTDQVPFLIYMYYKKSGMLVAYGMGTGRIENDSIKGCIERSPSLQMWGIEKPQRIEEAMQLMGWFDANLISISDATAGKLNVEKFLEQFSRSNSETCFITSRSLWPEPDR